MKCGSEHNYVWFHLSEVKDVSGNPITTIAAFLKENRWAHRVKQFLRVMNINVLPVICLFWQNIDYILAILYTEYGGLTPKAKKQNSNSN